MSRLRLEAPGIGRHVGADSRLRNPMDGRRRAHRGRGAARRSSTSTWAARRRMSSTAQPGSALMRDLDLPPPSSKPRSKAVRRAGHLEDAHSAGTTAPQRAANWRGAAGRAGVTHGHRARPHPLPVLSPAAPIGLRRARSRRRCRSRSSSTATSTPRRCRGALANPAPTRVMIGRGA